MNTPRTELPVRWKPRPAGERYPRRTFGINDIVLVEDSNLIYWPRTGEQFHIKDAAFAMARVQATLA
jgi:hypothetical protein